MKKIKIIAIVIVIANTFWGCEKDDLCDPTTPTTPMMIVEFYDNSNPSEKKLLNNLGIVAEGKDEGILFDNVSKILVPLNTTADVTRYSFILDAENTDLSLRDEDKVEINYTRKDEYVSRACGFKTVFTLKNTDGMHVTSPSDNWIKQIIIQKQNIINENEVHVKIYF